ncbi:MAG: transporter, partial [Candidatus Tectomicrobia bacterium]|nr:transporter [Candidatus Tectomicrobia bacterium]
MSMRGWLVKFPFICLLVLFSFSFAEIAESRSLKQPSLLGTTGLFDVLTADSLEKGNFSVGFYGSYAEDADNDRVDQITLQLGAAFGLFDQLEIGLNIPYIFNDDGDSPRATRGARSTFNRNVVDRDENGFGKVRFGAKYRLLNEGSSTPAVALEPFVGAPTQDQEKGLRILFTDPGVEVGANLLLSKNFGAWGFHGNLGYIDDLGSRVDPDDRVTLALGVTYDLIEP